MTDPVTDPPHYQAGDYQCNAVQDALAATLWNGHPKVVRLGNALKYLWRCCSKGEFEEQIRKAAFELLSSINEEWRMRVKPGTAPAAYVPKPETFGLPSEPDLIRRATINPLGKSAEILTYSDGTQRRIPRREKTDAKVAEVAKVAAQEWAL